MQLERRCQASWDNLKVIAKHETKPVLKSKLTDFLKDSTQRIVVLKVVHRRVLNRWAALREQTPGPVVHPWWEGPAVTGVPAGFTPSCCTWGTQSAPCGT